MSAGLARTLSKGLDALPQTVLAAHPRLQIYRMWIDMMQEKADLSITALREKEQMLRALPYSPENERLQVELIAVLCRFVAFAGDTKGAIRLGEEALARLPEGETALHARAHSALAVAYWLEGDAKLAEQAHERCIALAQASGNYSLAAHAMMIKGIIQTDYGRLRAAAHTYQAIIDMGGNAGQRTFFPAGQGYIGLAGIHLEWNELETAEDYLEEGMRLCRQGGLAGLSAAHTIKARLYQAQGAYEEAAEQLRLLGETGVDPEGLARQIRLALVTGEHGEAARLAAPWLSTSGADSTAPGAPLPITE